MEKKEIEVLFSYTHIVFCQEHYNPLGVIRTLGEQGIKPIVIVLRQKPRISSKSKYIKELFVVNDVEEGYRLLLDKFAQQTQKAFLYTADDTITSFLDLHYDQLKKFFFMYNCGEQGRITYYMDKNNINTLAVKHGLDVLSAIPLEKGSLPDGLEYPVITKAINSTHGGWKDDVFVCNNEDELKKAYKQIRSERVLVQKYIQKKNELCLDGLSYCHGEKVFIAIASNYKYILPKTYSSYMDVFNFKDEALFQKITSMFKEAKFEGIFSMEFLVDQNDQLHFCEINFRNSTWSYASTKLGMPLPILWALATVNGQLPADSQKQIPIGYTAIDEFADFRIRVLGRKLSFIKWLNELHHINCRYYYSKADKKPYHSKLFSSTIGRLFKH